MPIAEDDYQWFVEPRSDNGGDKAHTNGVFAKRIGSAEEFAMELKDVNGKPREVWHCPRGYGQVLEFWNSRGTLQIVFHVWNRYGDYGPIKFVTFLMPLGSGKQRIRKEINAAIVQKQDEAVDV